VGKTSSFMQPGATTRTASFAITEGVLALVDTAV
jgi:hypothetical protein